jgi:phage terminase large subunit GpA-like protein
MPFVNAAQLIAQSAAQAVEPDPELRLDEWAEQHVVVPKGSAFPGPYRISHTPPARRILQALSPSHPARRVVARVASQMLKTQVFICAALGWIAAAPANIIALEPNKTVTQRLSNRIEEAIRACDAVREKVASPRSRDKRNTIEDKQFDGGHLYILTAGSDANLAEVPARYLFCDEVNREGWRTNAREGSRVKLAEARLTSYAGMSKSYIVSSPTDIGASEITDLFEQGTQEHYHVPCPHCGHLHELVIENFHYRMNDNAGGAVDRAWFVCPDCGAEIDESAKADMLPDQAMGGQARWVQTATGDGETISVTLSAFYAPVGGISWANLAKEHAEAKDKKSRGDHQPMQVFVNTRLALDYDPSEITSTAHQLHQRAIAEALPSRVVPDRALVLTAYADTQVDRLEVGIEAWGPGLEHWTIDHQILWGSPTEDPTSPTSVWRRWEDIRRTPYAHASGALLRISAWGQDSGGANTQDVYNFAAGREHTGFIATKGANQPGRAIIASKPTSQDVNWRGERVPDGVKLWQVGTDTAKDWLNNRLRLVDGPGAAHWHSMLEPEHFEQLLSERPVLHHVNGRSVRRWHKPDGARNEVLDVAVGNLALAHYLGLHRWSTQDWQRLRANVIPADFTPDLFAAADAAAAPPTPTQLPPATAPTPHHQPPAQDNQPTAQSPAIVVHHNPAPPANPAPAPPAPPPATPAAPAMLPMQPPPPPQRRTFSRGLA